MMTRYAPIYRNLLDTPSDWLELAYLDIGGASSAEELLQSLVQSEPFHQFQAASGTVDFIRHLFFENKNHERLTGLGKLALGFPIISVRDGGEIQLKPLFFWKVELEAAGPKPDRWLIKRSPQNEGWMNPALAESFGGPVTTPSLDKAALLNALEEIEGLSESDIAEHLFSANPMPPIEDLWEEGDGFSILPSAVVGFFERPLQLSTSTPPEESDRSLDHDFGLPNLLPATESAYTTFRTGEKLAAFSDFSSELHKLLSKILTNQLANGHTTLVVSDRTARLEEVREHLATYDLENLCAIIRNPEFDRHLLTQLVANGFPESYVQASSQPLQLAVARFQRSYRKLKSQFEAVRTPLLFDWNWTEVVGQFLESQKIEGRELLDRQLKVSDFEWNEEEFRSIRSHLNETYDLFEKIGTLKHPLTVVHPEVFLNNNREGARAICEAGLLSWKKRLEELQYSLLENTNSYALRLTEIFENHYLELRTSLDNVFEMLEDFRTRFGKTAWERTNPGALSGILSERKRKIRAQYEEIQTTCKSLENQRQKAQLTPFEFARKINKPYLLQEEAERFQKELNQWRFRIPELVDEEVQRFSSKQVHPNAPSSIHPSGLESQMDEMLSTINATNWLADPLQHRMMSLPKRQKYIEKISETLDNVQINLRDFDPFYNWQNHWLQLDESSKLVVQALIKVKAGDWLAAFDSWYLHQILRRQPLENLPEQTTLLIEHLEASDALAQLLPNGIRDRWYHNFTTQLKKDRQYKSRLIKRLGQTNSANKPTVQEMFQEISGSMASRFPVMCMTTQQAGQLLTSESLPFDTLVCWETNDFPTALKENLEHRIERSVLLSEKRSTPKEGILNIDQPGTAFSGTWDRLPLEEMDWEVRPVIGSNNPDTRINEAEARYVLQLLNEIGRTQQRTFPKVGIITLGAAQRNRIAAYLLELKQTPNPGQEKVQQLDRNGMGVFTLAELAGQEFDLLIFSMELGLSSKENHEQVNALNYPNLETDLRRIYRQRRVILVHSIPKEILKAKGKTTQPLVRIIQFGKMIAGRNSEGARQNLAALAPETSQKAPRTTFHRVLAGIIEKETVWSVSDLYTMKNSSITPLRVAAGDSEEVEVALYPDLFLSSDSFTSIYWEASQWAGAATDIGKKMPVRSASFWRNPEQAKKQFLHQVSELLTPSPEVLLEEEE